MINLSFHQTNTQFLLKKNNQANT